MLLKGTIVGNEIILSGCVHFTFGAIICQRYFSGALEAPLTRLGGGVRYSIIGGGLQAVYER
jgi:hypothetical protein